MPTEDLNYIESLLEFSQQQDELIAGHQKEMSQVLANKEHLRTALACEHKKRMALEAENFELKKQIAQLQAENQQLRNRPIHTNTYIGNEYINQQHNYSVPRTSGRVACGTLFTRHHCIRYKCAHKYLHT